MINYPTCSKETKEEETKEEEKWRTTLRVNRGITQHIIST